MHITRIETHTREPLSFVKVYTSDGAEGIGQIAPYNADISALVLHRQVARFFLGKDPANLADLCQQAIEGNHKFPWSYLCRAIGGIDTALWDLKGKQVSKSVCELLGGKAREVPAYGSSMSRAIKPHEEALRIERLREEQGFRAFKIRIGSENGHDADAWPGRTEEVLKLVRHALGDATALLVDANGCYTPGKAIEIGSLLKSYNVCHYEEPCPYWELEWTAQVASALDIDVTGGEQDVDLAQWRRMIAMHAVDVVQPDICYVGGLTRALEVARMAAKAGKACIPHSANLSMVTVFSLHMMAAIANAGRYLEYSIEPTSWVENLFEPALTVRNGSVQVPTGPGWGVTINPDWFREAQVQVSKV